MLRFVLRAENKLPLIRRELPKLLEKLPHLEVISIYLTTTARGYFRGRTRNFSDRTTIFA